MTNILTFRSVKRRSVGQAAGRHDKRAPRQREGLTGQKRTRRTLPADGARLFAARKRRTRLRAALPPRTGTTERQTSRLTEIAGRLTRKTVSRPAETLPMKSRARKDTKKPQLPTGKAAACESFIKARYFTSIVCLAFASGVSLRLGSSTRSTPCSTRAEILSFSTSSGSIKVCWNFE